MITHAKCSCRMPNRSLKSVDPSSSGALSVGLPAERTVSPGTEVDCRASARVAVPASTFDSPGSRGWPSCSWTLGRLISASTSRTRCCACASATARFPATWVLPSPCVALATRIDRGPSPRVAAITLVRRPRNASTSIRGASRWPSDTRFAPRTRFSGTSPRNGWPSCSVTSPGTLMRSSSISTRNAPPTARSVPDRSDISMMNVLRGDTGWRDGRAGSII